MPQMKPMNWLMLFILTNLMLMMMNIMIYFLKNNNNKMNFNMKKNKFLNWKW